MMIEGRKYTFVGKVRHSIIDKLKCKSYFLDVQNRKADGLVVLLHKNFDKDFVQRVIKANRRGLKVEYTSLSFVDQYLHWFCNWDNSKHSDSFLQARTDVKASLEGLIGRQEKIYSGIKVIEQGMSRAVLDFAYKKERALYLCKVATTDKKDERKEKSLRVAAGFFLRRFGQDLRLIESYVVCLLPGKSPYFLLKGRRYSSSCRR